MALPTDEKKDTSSAPPPSGKTGGTKRKSRAPGIELDEKKINAPNRQTLGMLMVLTVVTLAMFGAGRAGCNLHPPRETRRPRVPKLEELARNPKDAAFELQDRLASSDYKGALQLAVGDLATSLRADQKKCDDDAKACRERREKLQGTLISVAEVMAKNPRQALVRVRTVNAEGGPLTRRYLMVRDASYWKGMSVSPDAGPVTAFPPLPPELDHPIAPPGDHAEPSQGSTESHPPHGAQMIQLGPPPVEKR